MVSIPSAALLVSTSWNTASDDLTSPPTRTLVEDFCENTLKSDDVYELYCTVLDVEVSEDQRRDAGSVGVTLIPATRPKWSNPVEDPPSITWLLNHFNYYPVLAQLPNVKHVVSFSSKTKNAAAAIHESLFMQARLQLSLPTSPGVVLAFDTWSRDACGLAEFHRSLIHDFLARKAESGEYLKAYSTVVDLELSADQIEDAEKCGVTLMKASSLRQKGVNEMPKSEWLINHEIYFPDLVNLKNIKYVVGYAPKTGWAAIDIQKKWFPTAKLVLINHAFQEKNCLLVKNEFSELKEEMLQMASHADMLFSIGPRIYDYFQLEYRAVIGGRKMNDIPHKEILPKPRQQYFDNKILDIDMSRGRCSILTYGQLNTEEALKRCDSIAASIGYAANKFETAFKMPPEWKIHGVSEQVYEKTETFLVEKLKSKKVTLKAYKHHSAETLLQSVIQSHLCLPPPCYTDYSFEGLEAMAAGLPTAVQGDSHIAAMIERHFKDHKDYCVVGNETGELTSKIITNLSNYNVAFQQANLLKEALAKSQAVTESLARFANSLGIENDEGSSKPLTEQVKELTKKLRSTEQALVSHQIERSIKKERLQSELEEKNKMIKELQDKGEKEGSSHPSREQVNELTKKLRNTEQALVSHQIESSMKKERFQSELEKKNKMIKELQDKGEKALEESQNKFVIERSTLQSQLKEAKEEKATLETRCKELTKKLENTEQSLVSQRIGNSLEREKLQSELEEKKKLIKDLEDKVTELEHKFEGYVDRKQATLSTAPEESQLEDAKAETAGLEEGCKELIQRSESTEGSIDSGHIGNQDYKQRSLLSELAEEKTSNKDISDKIMKSEEKDIAEKEALIKEVQDETGKSEGKDMSMQKQKAIDKLLQDREDSYTASLMQQKDSTYFVARVELTGESYEQQMRDLDRQYQTRSVLEKKLRLKSTWGKCKVELDKYMDEIISPDALHKMSGEGMKSQTAMKKRLTHTCKTANEQGEEETKAMKRQRSDSGGKVEGVGQMKYKMQKRENTDVDTAIGIQEGATCTEEDNDLKQHEVEKLQQQQKTINNLLDELENSYECIERKGDCRNIWLIADEETHFYKLPSGFQLEVPPNAVEESRRLVVTTKNDKRPPLKDYEYYESDVLEFEGNITFKQPVYISRPTLNVDPCERIQIIMRSKDGRTWEELETFSVERKTKVAVTHFCLHAAISRPVKDIINISKEGGKWSSSANDNVCLEVPTDALVHPRKFILELHQYDIDELAHIFAAEESFSPVIYLKEVQASNNALKKSVTLNMPLPPPIHQDTVDNTEVCILKDETGNCEWQNITECCTYHKQESGLKIMTQSLSGYSIGRCSRENIPTLCQTLSAITRMKKNGIHVVNFVLLQHSVNLCRLRCDIVETTKIDDISPQIKKYSSFTNMEYSGDNFITPGDVIESKVTGDFELTSSLNKRIYYPSMNNHWDVTVETLPVASKTTSNGNMQFNRGQDMVCELPFSISKEPQTSGIGENAPAENTRPKSKRQLSKLNCFLFDVSKQLSSSEEEYVFFLLSDHQIPKRDMDRFTSSLHVFQYLKETGKITDNNVTILEELFEVLGNEKVVKFVKDYQNINTDM